MKRIRLTKGKYALVDDEDFEYLNQWKWSWVGGERIYAARGEYDPTTYIKGKNHGRTKHIFMHRVIINSDAETVDHINGNTLDNQRSNLRPCSEIDNIRNQKMASDNTSGYKGVAWGKREKYWIAYITVSYKQKHLGYFRNKIDAAIAYDLAACRFFGEFARLNFPILNQKNP